MYCMSHMYGCMPGVCNIGRRRWQMRNRPGQVHFMRHMRGGLPGCGNCPRCAVIYITQKDGAMPRFLLQKHKFVIIYALLIF